MSHDRGGSPSACTRCPAAGRRVFLVDALRGGALALAALGLSPGRGDAQPLRFIAALASRNDERRYALPAGDGVEIDRDAEVILARTGRSVYAFSLACPHQNTALRWEASENRFQCPRHRSRYRADGTYIEGRATRSMDRYAVRRAGAEIIVETDLLYQEDMHRDAWMRAVVTLD